MERKTVGQYRQTMLLTAMDLNSIKSRLVTKIGDFAPVLDQLLDFWYSEGSRWVESVSCPCDLELYITGAHGIRI